MKNLKIAITGGCGFIGSNLVEMLHADNDVTVFDDLSVGLVDYIKDCNVRLIEKDLTRLSSKSSDFDDYDVIFHLAASGNVLSSIKDPINNFNKNVFATVNLLETVKLKKKVHFVFASTGGAIMGNTPPPVDEYSLPQPISPYGASKLSCEAYIKAYAACYGFTYSIFRFGNIIGKNSIHKVGVLNKFASQIKGNRPLQIYGNPTRDFVPVSYLSKILCDTYQNEMAVNQTYHVSSGIEVSIKDVAKICLNSVGKGDNYDIDVFEERVGEVSRTFARNNKLVSHFGRYEQFDVNSEIRDAFEWIYART